MFVICCAIILSLFFVRNPKNKESKRCVGIFPLITSMIDRGLAQNFASACAHAHALRSKFIAKMIKVCLYTALSEFCLKPFCFAVINRLCFIMGWDVM